MARVFSCDQVIKNAKAEPDTGKPDARLPKAAPEAAKPSVEEIGHQRQTARLMAAFGHQFISEKHLLTVVVAGVDGEFLQPPVHVGVAILCWSPEIDLDAVQGDVFLEVCRPEIGNDPETAATETDNAVERYPGELSDVLEGSPIRNTVASSKEAVMKEALCSKMASMNVALVSKAARWNKAPP